MADPKEKPIILSDIEARGPVGIAKAITEIGFTSEAKVIGEMGNYLSEMVVNADPQTRQALEEAYAKLGEALHPQPPKKGKGSRRQG